MIKHLGRLYDLTSKFENFRGEAASLDQREIRTRDDLKKATADAPIDDPGVSRKVAALSTILDTIASRRGHLAGQTSAMLAELKKALRDTEAAWNEVIAAHCAVIVERWIKVNAQFYPDGEKEARLEAQHGAVPGVTELRQDLTWNGEYSFTAKSAVPMICHFVRHLKKHCDKVNFSLPKAS